MLDASLFAIPTVSVSCFIVVARSLFYNCALGCFCDVAEVLGDMCPCHT